MAKDKSKATGVKRKAPSKAVGRANKRTKQVDDTQPSPMADASTPPPRLPGGAALRIPFEIQTEILKHLAAIISEEEGNGNAKWYWRSDVLDFEFHPSQKARDNLKNVALSTKVWLSAAQSLLFHQLTIRLVDELSHSPLESLLMHRPDLAGLVKRLDVQVLPRMTHRFDDSNSLSKFRSTLSKKLLRKGLNKAEKNDVIEAWKTYVVGPMCAKGLGAGLPPTAKRVISLVHGYLNALRWINFNTLRIPEIPLHPRFAVYVTQHKLDRQDFFEFDGRSMVTEVVFATAVREDRMHELKGLRYDLMELSSPPATQLTIMDGTPRIGPWDLSALDGIQYLHIDLSHLERGMYLAPVRASWSQYATLHNIAPAPTLIQNAFSTVLDIQVAACAKMLSSISNLKTLHIEISRSQPDFFDLLLRIWTSPKIKNLILANATLDAQNIVDLFQKTSLSFLQLIDIFPFNRGQSTHQYSWLDILRAVKQRQSDLDIQIPHSISLQLRHPWIHNYTGNQHDPKMDAWAERVLSASNDEVEALLTEGRLAASRVQNEDRLARKAQIQIEKQAKVAVPTDSSTDSSTEDHE